MDKERKVIQAAILFISLCIVISMFRLYVNSIELKEEIKIHFIL